MRCVLGIMLMASGHALAALDPEEMQRRLLAGAPILGEHPIARMVALLNTIETRRFVQGLELGHGQVDGRYS